MHPVLSSCRVFLNVLRDLIAGVRAGIGVERPEVASKAVAARVAAGLRLVEAYLRRVLIVMALEIEPSLVDAPKPMRLRRSNGRRKAARPAGFKVLDQGRVALPEDVLLGFNQDRAGPHTSASPSRSASADGQSVPAARPAGSDCRRPFGPGAAAGVSSGAHPPRPDAGA
jgi:hypothetical protein